MGYRIDYDGCGCTIKVVDAKRRTVLKRIVLCSLAMLCVIALILPDLRVKVRDLLLPGNDEVAGRALHCLITDLKEGGSFPEAVEAFCREIVSDG